MKKYNIIVVDPPWKVKKIQNVMKNLKHTIVARDKTTGIVRNFVFETVDDTIFVTENTVSIRSLDYAVKVKLLDRFYDLYKKGRKEQGIAQNYVDFFQARHFLLNEVEKAYEADRSTQ